jgi:hypothetical protein
MKKKIIVFLLFVLIINTFSFEISSIRKKHEEGFFVEFTSLGYAFKNSEISTQPLLDILGVFNLNYRNYLNDNSVISSQNYFIDPLFVSKVYMGEDLDSTSTYILASRNYYFSNYYFDRFSVKPYFEITFPGITDLTDYAFGIVPRAFINVGYFIRDNLEFFGALEGGVIFNIFTTSNATGNEWDTFIQELRQESVYSTFKIGLSWYYDKYSGIEIGYRLFLWGRNSPLRFIQGFTTTDWIYNIINLLVFSENGTDIFIPFITTDYYISFSTKF